ncbi:MAG: helix-turn-helix domain-containing protein [Pseudomonadota bacterium]
MLAFESGFSSKSTFNAAFKKSVGVPPGDYRRSLTPAQ